MVFIFTNIVIPMKAKILLLIIITTLFSCTESKQNISVKKTTRSERIKLKFYKYIYQFRDKNFIETHPIDTTTQYKNKDTITINGLGCKLYYHYSFFILEDLHNDSLYIINDFHNLTDDNANIIKSNILSQNNNELREFLIGKTLTKETILALDTLFRISFNICERKDYSNNIEKMNNSFNKVTKIDKNYPINKLKLCTGQIKTIENILPCIENMSRYSNLGLLYVHSTHCYYFVLDFDDKKRVKGMKVINF